MLLKHEYCQSQRRGYYVPTYRVIVRAMFHYGIINLWISFRHWFRV